MEALIWLIAIVVFLLVEAAGPALVSLWFAGAPRLPWLSACAAVPSGCRWRLSLSSPVSCWLCCGP